MNKAIDQICDSLMRGDAVLFLGAGYSADAKNHLNENLPTGWELRNELLRVIGVDPSVVSTETPLDSLVDYVLSDGQSKPNVVARLLQLFKVETLRDWQIELVTRFPWKRIYTTNFDDAVEVAFTKQKKSIHLASALDNYAPLPAAGPSCIHLNGMIGRLNTENIDSTLRLSFAAYAANHLQKSTWADIFERDVTYAGCVVFVGFRLPDLDIARLLIGAQIKDKTFFFLGNKPDPISNGKLNAFGQVLPFRGDELTNAIPPKLRGYANVNPAPPPLKYFKKVAPSPVFSRPNDNDRIALLMYGDAKDSLLETSAIASKKQSDSLYSIARTAESEIAQALNTSYDIALVSRLGNGKSILMRRLSYQLVANGWLVYRCLDSGAGALGEVSRVLALAGTSKTLIMIDGALLGEDVIRALGQERSENIRLLLSERSNTFDSRITDDWLGSVKVKNIYESNIDDLDDLEIDELISVLDNAGLWGANARKNEYEKKYYVANDCHRQLSQVLLHVAKSKDIADRVKKSFATENLSEAELKVFVTVAAMGVVALPISMSLLGKVVGFESANRFISARSEFRSQLFRVEGRQIFLNSSLFGMFFLRELLPVGQVVQILADVVRRAINAGLTISDPNAFWSVDKKNRFPVDLYVFRNVQQLVQVENHRDEIYWFYEEIRNDTNLADDPLYWLQYAIAKLFGKEPERTKQYLDNAYGCARKIPGYNTFQIDNQYARYLLESANTSGDTMEAFGAFEEAHRIIADQTLGQTQLHYPYRVAAQYWEFYSLHGHALSAVQKSFLVNAAQLVYSRSLHTTIPAAKKSSLFYCQRRLEKLLKRCGASTPTD